MIISVKLSKYLVTFGELGSEVIISYHIIKVNAFLMEGCSSLQIT
jgi:hypothetical protein